MRKMLAILMVGMGVASAAFGQAPAQPVGPAAEALAAYNRVKPNILKAAEKMPAENYGFKPVPDIRTFARVVNHVTEAQEHTCSALNGTTWDPKTLPAETADKAATSATRRLARWPTGS
jgi:uncharacterized damage-inducible protein DinB